MHHGPLNEYAVTCSKCALICYPQICKLQQYHFFLLPSVVLCKCLYLGPGNMPLEYVISESPHPNYSNGILDQIHTTIYYLILLTTRLIINYSYLLLLTTIYYYLLLLTTSYYLLILTTTYYYLFLLISTRLLGTGWLILGAFSTKHKMRWYKYWCSYRSNKPIIDPIAQNISFGCLWDKTLGS